MVVMAIKDCGFILHKEWKIRQELYHRMVTDHTDDLNKIPVEFSNDVVENAIKYFYDKDMPFIYPSKSYVVAICYAYWLSKDFNEDFYELLNDDDLLYRNDPYFKTYNADINTYDSILNKIMPLNETKGIVPDIKEYYKKEFLIDES
jgi:hypothetical protein